LNPPFSTINERKPNVPLTPSLFPPSGERVSVRTDEGFNKILECLWKLVLGDAEDSFNIPLPKPETKKRGILETGCPVK